MESGIIMANESNSNTIGYINLNKKLTRKRTAANPHGAFEVAGAGNEVTYTIAPVLDPTYEQFRIPVDLMDNAKALSTNPQAQ